SGGTCQGPKKCVGGPLDGTTCTSSGTCNGCNLSPPQGSCAIVQASSFPIRVSLNGICVPRTAPDTACVTSAECPSGKTCQLAQFDVLAGGLDPATMTRPLTIAQGSVKLAPAAVPGVGTVCVAAGGDGVGKIDCDGGEPNLNLT